MAIPCLNPEVLGILLNHVVFPEQLPSSREGDTRSLERNLVDGLIKAAEALVPTASDTDRAIWEDVRKTLCVARKLNNDTDSEGLEKNSISNSFRQLASNESLILHVKEQNAGLLVKKTAECIVEFEAFEASPHSRDVLAAEGALQWRFPGAAAAISLDIFTNPSFQESLAGFLEQCSSESFPEFASHTHKAGVELVETREPANPALISQLLMTILEALGRKTKPTLLHKRIRDDVLWGPGSGLPWRRAPYWLVLRVGLVRHLDEKLGPEAGHACYKLILCVMFAQLLCKSTDVVSIELLHNLKAKLARRIAKLQNARRSYEPRAAGIYDRTLPRLEPLFHEAFQSATECINRTWRVTRAAALRRIHRLPLRADPDSLRLTLPNSGPILKSILANRPSSNKARGPSASPGWYGGSSTTKAIVTCYSQLKHIEQEVENGAFATRADGMASREACVSISNAIGRYLSQAGSAYDGLPELQSIKILTVMDMWMVLDKRATGSIRLLLDYGPVVSSRALDVLQLPERHAMYRLRAIQDYLQARERQASSNARTIFDNPHTGSFAVRYYNECDQTGKMANLRRRIEEKSESARIQTIEEWIKLGKTYEELSLQLAQSLCTCETGKKRSKNCPTCKIRRQRKKIKVKIHEDFLPEDQAQTKTIIFELQCPPLFAAYRNAAWNILNNVGYPSLPAPSEKTYDIREYKSLAPFRTASSGSITLASKIKSHLKSHYKFSSVPATIEGVLRPHGMTYSYSDATTRVWCSQDIGPSFAHLCQWTIPQSSPLAQLKTMTGLSVESEGPSSNEILASQSQCPHGVSVHEFTAVQSLFTGRSCRWPSILVELGSSNLNFSSETISLIVAQLAVQAGPGKPGDALRTTHGVFREQSFCARLVDQIGRRLDLIAVNWREAHMMDMLIVLLLRLASLADAPASTGVFRLLEKAQSITHQWMKRLRTELHQATTSEVSQKLSRQMLWAALLCRRACTAFFDQATAPRELQPQALQSVIEASMAVHENFCSDLASLPDSLRLALLRDIRASGRMGRLVQSCIERSPGSLTAAIDSVWPSAEGSETRQYSQPEFIKSSPGQLVMLKVDWQGAAHRQILHYDVVSGGLWIDYKPLSQLPTEYRDNWMMKELFGSQHLLTYPSYMPGMEYMLNFTLGGHQIHFGTREKRLIIRARYRGHTLEFLPRAVFGSLEKPDLPASLVENCIHWFDVDTGVVEARQMPDIWVQKESNWIIDVTSRLARRRNVFLVDPSSTLFNHVASIFHGFEHRARLTVFQPESKDGGLSVELRRLDLSFVVKEKGLLHCRELHADLDPDQDAGTWYGFDSKIVLRDSQNPQRRSILVPLGPLSWKRRGTHVAVHAENGGTYGIFTINTVLGRLDCPAEARLLLFKALLHAYTASIALDPLTRRSGTEEALHCLHSAQNQPWMPLNPAFEQYLSLLAGLAPKRVYYPPGKKVMQQVFWDDRLPPTTQHESFHAAIAAIYQKSMQLSAFSPAESVTMSLEDRGDAHLRKRSSARRSNFWRRDLNCVHPETCCDATYQSRDCQTQSDRRARVWECTTLIDTWSAQFSARPHLARLLRGWPVIHARGEPAVGLLLSNLLGAEAAMEWGSWLSICSSARVADKYLLCFVLGALAFRKAHDMDLVRTLIAFAVLDDLKALELPAWPLYTGFEFRQTPTPSYLSQLMAPFCTPCPGSSTAEKERITSNCHQVATIFASQWPCHSPGLDEIPEEASSFMNFPGAIDAVMSDWVRLKRNFELSEWVSRVQSVLNRLNIGARGYALDTVSDDCKVTPHGHRKSIVPHLEDLLRESCVLPEPAVDGVYDKQRLRIATHEKGIGGRTTTSDKLREHRPLSPELRELRSIIASMISTESEVRSQYAKDLNQSLQALEAARRDTDTQGIAQTPSGRTTISSVDACNAASARLEQISQALEAGKNHAVWLKYGGLWPCISPVTVLERLRTTAKVQFGTGMRDTLIQYGQSITKLQQHLRIDDALMRGRKKAMAEELGDLGHANWSPAEYPDWLLLEIEGNLLIRSHQVDVALSTISPHSGSNSVLQMNMGQGKTSCIIPMVAVALADQKQLVRIVIPRALLAQTAQVLQARLGNLLGREVRSVPFSRRTPTTLDSINTFTRIHQEIMSSCGVIITLPENILSFKLSGTQRLLDGRIEEASCMLKAQKWMERASRDVLDECDFTLSTRTQLIYPSGPQESLDGQPSRWLTAEMLLELVHSHLETLKHDFPHSVRVIKRECGGFPWVYFLRSDAENALVSRLVNQLALGKTRILTLERISKKDYKALKRFIRDIEVHVDDERRLEALFKDRSASRKTIYLLRGLLAHGILILTLKKKWNVQYGLHPMRDPVAVPYHAKGVPSDQAEWGHPDVCILLTCLSFYFAGLNVSQLQKCVLQVLQSDDPASEYGRWVGSSQSLPVQLQEWNVINVDDELQLQDLWKHLRYNVIVIDLFLNHFVFPVHARHFQAQIGASGWDIPLYQPQKPQSSKQTDCWRTPLTTGFSGTNDNRYLLPLTIEQHDLGSLAHTNADVLTYLLQPRNRGYILAAKHGQRLSEEMLLWKAKELGIRVLIDAGAQILEMDNFTLVKNWMRVDTKAKAGLYFNADNKPFIVYRSGTQVPLLASSFANDLRECVVYLDEAHTRGTDLKLPSDARGALTLGLAQTKDHTVQAAMRLRQLATTQSVVFFAPPEVHQSILDHCGKRSTGHIDSRAVVEWLLEQTCRGIEQLQPLYRSQGIDFCCRSEIGIRFPNHIGNKNHRDSFVREIRQVCDHTLQKMYQPRRWETTPQVLEQPSPALTAFLAKLGNQTYDSDSPSSTAFQEVEQEREVAHEVEAIRKTQKPILYEALPYRGLHEDIVLFERTGRPKHESDGYGTVSLAIRHTQTGKKYEAAAAMFDHRLFASTEVFRTVKLEKPDDDFLRPVTWLLWSTQAQTALMVTPEEAEDLISRKRGDEHPLTHLLAYAAPVSRKMSYFNKLDYYAVPAMPASYTMPLWLPIQLGLFAGRLYFEFDEHDAIATFLHGNNMSHGRGSARWQATEQGPVDQDSALPSVASNWLVFLQEWVTARRKGQDFSQTPMGEYDFSSPMDPDRGLDGGIAQEIGNSDSKSCNGDEGE
ncbi:uncharacterized protein BKCO1_7800036 [Diplodia corticola]|uniref:ubiquitinyl hydrolase 1 n=1 Tax=Diplodia corticola TaxID=236234 RepID=A0A1J9QM45_9PEZI|nr:uncharacterized protein BKCO1_7800036 [Diplodia corticola]OJD29536.1 hypothetical protein BKCO1_7800036 [Diplodia corticola]